MVNSECQDNHRFAQQYAVENQWQTLHIYEKYVKDKGTGDDVSLTIPREEFRRALEGMYRRVQLYSDR